MLDLELKELIVRIRHYNPSVIGIQLPAGLRQRSREISEFFNSEGYEVLFSGDPSYGACDIADDELAGQGADVMVHFGHSKMIEDSTIPVIYWEVKDDIPLIDAIKENIGKLRAAGNRMGLVTTVQHVHKLDQVKKYLQEQNFDVFIGQSIERCTYEGQILGCSFETVKDCDVDFFVYIGTGYFHPIGISLASQKKVLYCDPYTRACKDISEERNKILKKRYANIALARDKKYFAIVVSLKKGQYRLKEAKEIKKLLNKNGKNCQFIFTYEINKDLIRDFDFEAFIIAACPRIAIDDAPSFDKPVLTISEAKMMFIDQEYFFDEIHKL